MPTYDYECQNCGHTTEAFQSISDDPLTTCPECGKDELKRLISAGVGIIFKGSGFYATDSKKTAASAKTKSDEGTSTSKTEKASGSENSGGSDKSSGSEKKTDTTAKAS
jgi:putative FmdB family regulatory protein